MIFIIKGSVNVPEFDKYPKKAGGYNGRNVVEIIIKMKTIVRKLLNFVIESPSKISVLSSEIMWCIWFSLWLQLILFNCICERLQHFHNHVSRQKDLV